VPPLTKKRGNMALKKFKCLRCDKEFEAGSWNCADGKSHLLEIKTYYMLDCPFVPKDGGDPRIRERAHVQVLNVVPESKRTVGTDVFIIPGTHVDFYGGRFSTADPALQYGLDNHPKVFHGEEGMRLWENNYYTEPEKRERENTKLKGEISRLENERNTLLQQVQEKAKKVAVPA
jgi:hypothetical protein